MSEHAFDELWNTVFDRVWKTRTSAHVTRANGNHLLLEFGQTRIGQIDSEAIARYRSQRRQVAKASTVNREVACLRFALRYAIDPLRWIDRAPLRWGTEPEASRDRCLSQKEAQAVLAWLESSKRKTDRWAYHMIRVLLSTGARAQEILSASDAAITDQEDSIRIAVSSPKEGVPKVIMVTNGAIESVRWLMSNSTTLDRSFCHFSNAECSHLTLRRRLAVACRKVGIEPATLHDLRRTFASWALRSGASLEQVGQTLGHLSVQTTRRYARLDEAGRIAVASRVSALL